MSNQQALPEYPRPRWPADAPPAPGLASRDGARGTAFVGASLVELAACRLYIQPSLFRRIDFPVRQLWISAVPLLLFALSMRVVDKLDLIMLQGLRGRVSEAGLYGAAQNLTLLGALFSAAFAPLLQSTLTRLLRDGQFEVARRTGHDALRIVIAMLPFAAIVSGAATEIAVAIFGESFRPAGLPLALLIFSSIGFVMISVCTAILIADGKAVTTVCLTAPLVLIGLAGNFLLIPNMGVRGAALVTTGVAAIGAIFSVFVVVPLWKLKVPAATFVRSVLISVGAYLLTEMWPASGFLPVTVKLCVLGALVPCAFFILGEFDAADRRAIAGSLRRKPALAQPVSL